MNFKKIKISVIGLGYVGLPLAIEFGEKYNVVGFDINTQRVKELSEGFDRTKEISNKKFQFSSKLKFSNKKADIKNCNVYIVTVPTVTGEFRIIHSLM